MSWRQWANNHPASAAGIVAVVLGVAMGVLYSSTRTSSTAGPEQAWFFDVGNGELFAVEWEQIPPVESPSGTAKSGSPGGVRAHVFTCDGDCRREADRFIGYLETYDPSVKEQRLALAQAHGTRPEGLSPAILRMAGLEESDGRYVARPDQPDAWFPLMSGEGEAIAAEPYQRCEAGGRPRRCWPDMR